MILVFAEDSTVSAYENEGQINVDCEGIDVENGVYTFIDERGYLFRYIFDEPNKGLLFGFIEFLNSSSAFRLELTSERNTQLLHDFLEGRVFFDKGTAHIRTSEELKQLILTANPELN
ncbi:MAG TPA: hypothetical protein VGB77_09750 [Abditibacteriaceae bacterium]|jgi:hypothetical protein